MNVTVYIIFVTKPLICRYAVVFAAADTVLFELPSSAHLSRERVADIEDKVHRRHPQAVVGGVGWSIQALEN